ncbi:MAG: YbhB/YbcL family Raf kinase inhibitor-like protein [Gemmatimonadetes bacterium]|nr:YbhB/YbcL family Raf kinase inhibitor-like protein [Gemmatimonadota bacterium]
MAFDLTSPAFDEGDAIPVRNSCDGEDVSPPLAWSDAPDGTEAYALTLTDPDAPGGTFTHWVLYDLPGHAAELPEGVGDAPRLENLGSALQGQNDFGETGYGGPCPPAGSSHRYVFTLYALDAPAGLDAGASREDLEGAIEGHVLGTADLTGTYRRQG